MKKTFCLQPMSVLAFLFFLHAVVSGCAGREASYKNYDAATPATTYRSEGDEATGQAAPESSSADGSGVTLNLSGGTQPVALTASKIIKNASIKMQVEKYAPGLNQVKQIVNRQGGVISAENEYNSPYRLENNMVIRIPAQRFDTLVTELLAIAIYVENKQITSEDVTEQYVDIEARMNAKKQVEARYLDILKKAGKIDEILSVERQLGIIREEIDAAQGKLKYFDSRVQYSTINLNLYQQLDYTAPSPDRRFTGRIKEAFLAGWRGLLEFLVGLVNIWPFLLILVASLWAIARWRKNKRNAKKQMPVIPPNPEGNP
ncbi:DUF4349 domain-containing protein [Sphingobacteriales bacterium UPWRP_1]|nr:hypothetical protein B6N25_14290 [Sphingobacteriales bacterium TSM_CSS]PSJ74705.1 DUF4349 domain-containing protein [Sphingobacteriales bacterium UPWRP_1]